MVRVRIAPSPTGEPHFGNIRTAIFNWLFARNKGGKFIVRIEDTDRERFDPKSQTAILESLRWLKLDWDEGPDIGGPYDPYVQSERKELYQKYAQELVENGHAYYCFCSEERLAQMRQEQQKRGEPPRYDKKCRAISPKEAKRRMENGESAVLRLKVPSSEKTVWEDLVHGKIEFENSSVDDQILIKSDGYPTYHLAVVVDDYLMKISHVLRADEWISSTPKQILLYKFFGWELPEFGHLPMVLGPNRAKLSKRHGATSVLTFRDEGYLPEAMLNFLALLGWAYDDKTEIFSCEELIKKFSLEKINPSKPIFDYQKLEWMNGFYIRQKSTEELFQILKDFLSFSIPVSQKFTTIVENFGINPEYVKKIIPLVKERMKKLSEFTELTDFFFEDIRVDKNLLIKQAKSEETAREQIEKSYKKLQTVTDWKTENLEAVIRPLGAEKDWKPSHFFMTLRLAISGRTATPPLFETMEVLGKEVTLSRLKSALFQISLMRQKPKY